MRQLVVLVFIFGHVESVWQKPAFCGVKQCPEYTVIEKGNGFEKRKYASATWISAFAQGTFVDATATLDAKLKAYLNGKNEEGKQIPVAAPTVTMFFPVNGVITNFTKFYFIPKSFTPAPKAVDINIKDVTPKDMYIRAVERKISTIEDWEKESKKLETAINDKSKFYSTFFFGAIYPPSESGLEYNEVWFHAI